MTCQTRFGDEVELAAINALDVSEMAQFEAHAGACSSCLIRLDHIHEVIAALVPDTEPPIGVWTRIEAAIRRPLPEV